MLGSSLADQVYIRSLSLSSKTNILKTCVLLLYRDHVIYVMQLLNTVAVVDSKVLRTQQWKTRKVVLTAKKLITYSIVKPMLSSTAI